jgi:HK97 family phage major capsid protein
MLEQLRTLLAAVVQKMEGLNKLTIDEKGNVRSFSETEEQKYKEYSDEAERLRAMIRREESLQEAREDARRLDQAANNAPRIEVTREHNHNAEGEYRGFRPLGQGGYGEFLQCVQRFDAGKGEDKRLRELRAATGANEQVGYEGGSLIQSDHAEDLFTVAKQAGKLASKCKVIPVKGNSTTILRVDETSMAIGSQFGGVRAYWRKEAGTVTPTRPKFREENIQMEAMEALFYATEEQLEDAPQLETFANMAFGEAIGYQVDDAIVAGNGAGKPLGILNSPCLIVISKESGQAAASLLYANLDNMVDRLLVGCEENAILMIHPSLRQKLRNVYATPGSNTDFMPFLMSGGGKAGQLVDPINGFPIERVQQCKAPGSKGDIILGDLSKYHLYRKGGIKASQSMHVAFLTSERVFKWTVRLNGQPALVSAVQDANGSTTRSAFVALEERA